MSPKKKHLEAEARLIVIAAPSGAGKTTLCERLIQDFPEIELSTSMTTRTKRANEVEGKHYYFVNHEAFEKKIKEGYFAEWAKVHEQLYGTPREEIEKRLAQQKHVLFDIDVQGAMSLLKAFGDKVLLVFILPPSLDELRGRLIERKGNSERDIETRLQNAYNEIKWSQKFDYQIVNDDLDRAYQSLKHVIKKECF